MSAALELVKIALRAYGSGDPEITIELCDPLIRWDERASRPDGDLVWGQENVLRAMRDYLNGWQEYRFEVEKIAEVAPRRIVGLCRERGRSEADVPVDRHYGGLWIVEAHKITSWATYLTPKEAVGAARELGPSRFTPAELAAQDAAAGKTGPGARGAAGTRAPGKQRRPRTKPKDRPAPAITEEQRQAAKRRAKLVRAAREGGRRAPTS